MKAGSAVGILSVAVGLACTVRAQTGGTNSARTVQLPDVEVRVAALREEGKVGPYEQPEWTTHRRFPTTRVYVQDTPWEVEVEQWARYQYFRDKSSEWLFQTEATIGLPHRFQFDLYENWVLTSEKDAEQESVAAELRYAFADWGRIPMNPTLYLEYKLGGRGKSDAYEAKLLFGDELASGWHWGINVFAEQETSKDEATEAGISMALGYSLLDRRLGVGVEAVYEESTVKGERDDPEKELLAGPSVQWRPAPSVHVDVAPLFGISDDAPRVECWCVVGFDLGCVSSSPQIAPKATQSR